MRRRQLLKTFVKAAALIVAAPKAVCEIMERGNAPAPAPHWRKVMENWDEGMADCVFPEGKPLRVEELGVWYAQSVDDDGRPVLARVQKKEE